MAVYHQSTLSIHQDIFGVGTNVVPLPENTATGRPTDVDVIEFITSSQVCDTGFAMQYWFIYAIRGSDKKKDQAIPPKIYPDDSIWLYDVLNTIGANTLYRETRQQTGVLSEILESFKDKTSCHYMGGTFEGTDTPGESSDLDFMACVKMFSVIEDISNAKFLSLLIIRESYTHDGYVKLQLVVGGVPCTSEHWTFVDELFPDLETSRFFKIDTMQRILLFECTLSANRELFSRPTNKPADLTIGKFSLFKTDTVVSYRGKTWPSMANEWLSRDRKNGWPTKKNIKELKSLGFFVVRKGHPSSLDKDLEWRISLSLQERKLMFNLTDVQHKCYVILKIFNRNIIKLDCITTYHWKTCLFYVIEENNGNIWKKKLLWYCIRLCIRLMIKWVKCGICPNYFIPGENLFDGRLNISGKNKSEKSLEKMLYLGADCLLLVNQNNLCHYIRLRESAVCFQLLQTISKFDNNEALFTAKLSIIQVALDVFNHEILERYVYQANDETLTFIQFLCSTIYRIKKTCDDNTTEHTTREIKASLSFLLPNIYTCLASNISALAIKNQENVFRNFLLLVSYALFAQGGLPGRLKLISVLYAAKLYNDCERHIDTLNEVDIMHNPSLCRCRYIINDMRVSADNCFDTQQLNVSTCVSFLPTEILITPDAMQYEMFRYVGISLTEEEKSNVFGRWQYRAVVDSNVLFFLLKYLTKRKLEKVKDCEDAKISIENLLSGRNVRHRDVANNILAWICCSELNTYAALCYSISSWKEMISTDLCLNITIKKMKQKQYLYNAAKIHAIVILYNTWFANKSPRIHFCYQCFCKSPVIKCSRCKVSTYCCELCKAKNRRIHEAACKIARSYHDH